MVIVRIWEGLGNQLFQYAFARALQIRTGKKVALDISGIYKQILEGDITKRRYTLKNFCIKLPIARNVEKSYFFLEQKNLLQKILFQLSKNKLWPYVFYKEQDILYKPYLKAINRNCYLMGWFQNDRYFKEYRSILLKELKLKKPIKVSDRLREVLKNEETIFVHIRRGDFIKYNNTLPASYYRKAKLYIEQYVHNPFYLIFSDDTEWVKKVLNFGEHAIFVKDEGLQDFEELMIMSYCKHNIIANSTFSWWGAWLNQNENKKVIGPKQWYKKVWFHTTEEYSDCNIMPIEWKRI